MLSLFFICHTSSAASLTKVLSMLQVNSRHSAARLSIFYCLSSSFPYQAHVGHIFNELSGLPNLVLINQQSFLIFQPSILRLATTTHLNFSQILSSHVQSISQNMNTHGKLPPNDNLPAWFQITSLNFPSFSHSFDQVFWYHSLLKLGLWGSLRCHSWNIQLDSA